MTSRENLSCSVYHLVLTIDKMMSAQLPLSVLSIALKPQFNSILLYLYQCVLVKYCCNCCGRVLLRFCFSRLWFRVSSCSCILHAMLALAWCLYLAPFLPSVYVDLLLKYCTSYLSRYLPVCANDNEQRSQKSVDATMAKQQTHTADTRTL